MLSVNIQNILNSRKQQGLFRSLSTQPNIASKQPLIDFANNDYLGLANHPEISQAAIEAYKKYGSGSRGSRLLGGNCEIFEETEKALAEWKGTESALIFNCGYSANAGVISALCSAGALDGKTGRIHLFLDRLDHASIIDGYRMSNSNGITLHRFKHNNPADLEKALKAASLQGARDAGAGAAIYNIIAVEAVYSMDGDIAPLKEYADLAEKYNAFLYVDEAHSDGILGNGKGLAAQLGLEKKVDLSLTTFGKAFGCAGACVFGDKVIIDYIMNFARSFIYSTALPPGAAAAMRKSAEVSAKETWRCEKALRMAKNFREQLKKAGFDTLNSETQIVPVVFGEPEKALEAQKYLKENGFFVAVVRPPTVPNGTARLRINVTAAHTEEQVQKLAELLCGINKNG